MCTPSRSRCSGARTSLTPVVSRRRLPFAKRHMPAPRRATASDSCTTGAAHWAQAAVRCARSSHSIAKQSNWIQTIGVAITISQRTLRHSVTKRALGVLNRHYARKPAAGRAELRNWLGHHRMFSPGTYRRCLSIVARAASEMEAFAAAYTNPAVAYDRPVWPCWIAPAEEAAGHHEKADAVLKMAGTYVDCYRFRGDILDGRGDWAGAQKAYADAVALAPIYRRATTPGAWHWRSTAISQGPKPSSRMRISAARTGQIP